VGATVGESVSAHAALNALSETEARAVLTRACGSVQWVNGMLSRRPFATEAALFQAADSVWESLATEDHLEAFTHHPKIGADLAELARRFPSTATLSAGEQSSVERASDRTLHALRELNQSYEARFGFIFIVCASGKSAEEMLALLEQRLNNPAALELSIAAAEQAKITRLRLSKLSGT
jgi:2-oxo-4-hydroxy-4-carboxy-5-ureidoimidazoline decarboxylase